MTNTQNTNKFKNVILLAGRTASGKTSMLISYANTYPNSTLFISAESSNDFLINKGLNKDIAYFDGTNKDELLNINLTKYETICIDYLELFNKEIIKNFIDYLLCEEKRIVVATQMRPNGIIDNIFEKL